MTMTVVASLRDVQLRIEAARNTNEQPLAGREYSLAITAVEDAILRFNRGFAMQHGLFHVSDVEASHNDRGTVPPVVLTQTVDEYAPADLTGDEDVDRVDTSVEA